MNWATLPAPVGVTRRLKFTLDWQRYAHCYDTEAGPRIRSRRAFLRWRKAIRAAGAVRIEYR